jgi:hypothetical protein
VGFFSNGFTIALLCRFGKVFCSNDLLHMAAITGEMTELTPLRSQVGMGSDVHCLFADRLRRRDTSVLVTGLKVSRRFVIVRFEMTGADDEDVA